MEWISTKIRFPKEGEDVLAACKNKNKEDGIWLYDLCCYYPNTGWEDRVNWEDVLYWTYIDEPKEVELEEIKIPRWFLENVENTLRIQYNINLEKNGETCQDRNIKESLNGVRKLLNGKELTGMERLEKLIPYTLEVKKVDLNEEIEKCLKQHSMLAVGKKDFTEIAKHFYSLGLAQKGE